MIIQIDTQLGKERRLLHQILTTVSSRVEMGIVVCAFQELPVFLK